MHSTHIHTRTCTHMAYTHAMHTQHAPYKHTYTHHTHIHNIHTYMHLNSGLSQNKACPKFRIINLPQKWNMYQFPYLTHYKHQHSATPTSTHQYPTHSHTDILTTGIPHNHPTHPNTHSSHTHPERSRDEGLVRGLGLARPHLHALWTKLMLILILAGREMEGL